MQLILKHHAAEIVSRVIATVATWCVMNKGQPCGPDTRVSPVVLSNGIHSQQPVKRRAPSAILKHQPGFVDEITLVSSNNPDRLLALSFWQSEGDAERYNKEQYPTVAQIVTPYVQGQPTVETFQVDTSTVHKIAKGKAA